MNVETLAAPAGVTHIPADTVIATATGIPQAMGKVCDRDSTRYALGGVEISAGASGRLSAAATDTRHLVAVTIDGEITGAGSLSRPIVLPPEVIPPRRKARETLADLICHAGGEIRSRAGRVMRAIEGRFPAWRDIIPHTVTGTDSVKISQFRGEPVEYVAVTIDPAFLRNVCEVIDARSLPEDRGCELLIPVTGEHAVYLVRRDVVGVVMPLSRDDGRRKKDSVLRRTTGDIVRDAFRAVRGD